MIVVKVRRSPFIIVADNNALRDTIRSGKTVIVRTLPKQDTALRLFYSGLTQNQGKKLTFRFDSNARTSVNWKLSDSAGQPLSILDLVDATGSVCFNIRFEPQLNDTNPSRTALIITTQLARI